MKKLNVGLVGAGFMGKAHSIGYSDMPKYFWPAPAVPVLKTICDIVPEIAADAKERFGFEKCCTDWRDIVNDPEIDVVSICTPNNVHAEIAIAALNAGKHVLCEKPIASTLEDAKAMAEAAKKAAQKKLARTVSGIWRSPSQAITAAYRISAPAPIPKTTLPSRAA